MGGIWRGRMSALFGFTALESELANVLMTSKSIEQIAAARGVTISTIRAKLRSIFAKTGTGNQRDLARLLASIPRVED